MCSFRVSGFVVNDAAGRGVKLRVLYKILSKGKYFNYTLQNTFLKVFQLLLSITLDKWPKIQNTFNESN